MHTCRSPFHLSISRTRGVCGLAIDRAPHNGHAATVTAHVHAQLITHVRIEPPSVLNACGSRAHEPPHDTTIMHREHWRPRRPRSRNRRAASSMIASKRPRPSQRPQRPLPACRTAGYVAASRQAAAATICSQSSQTLPPSTDERMSADVSFSGSDRVGSRSKRCLPEAIPRWMAASRHSPRDIWSSLSVRRANLRTFTKRVTRMYLLSLDASRVLHRTKTGRCARRVRTYPFYRHGRAVTEAAKEGTCVQSVARTFHGSKKASVAPLSFDVRFCKCIRSVL